jgi:ribose 5-phosphate isomerase B
MTLRLRCEPLGASGMTASAWVAMRNILLLGVAGGSRILRNRPQPASRQPPARQHGTTGCWGRGRSSAKAPARLVSQAYRVPRVACAAMRISVAADEDIGIARAVLDQLRARGHDPLARGALAADERADWAWAAESAARDVADGHADAAVVCCWTGTGASIAANKVPGIRAALCWDAQTAAGARRWNDANVLALSLRTTSEAVLSEILDAWFTTQPSADDQDRANVDHVNQMGG